ncbi:tetratricopeptide repeat protein [Methanomethylovorans sp.]
MELDPQYAMAWYNKGWALDQLGRNDEAQECYDKAAELGFIL